MRVSTLVFAFVVFVAVGYAVADPTNSPDVTPSTSLSTDYDDLLKRVETLEGQQGSLPSWLDRFTFKGDFRLRYEMINKEGKDRRHRGRFRSRFFVGAEVNKEVDFGFQIASGNSDPVSTNQSMDDAWSTKDAGIDLAYVDYHPIVSRDGGWNLKFIGGKMKTPFRVMSKSELLWDPDLRPEGIAALFSKEYGGFTFFGSAGGFYIEERSSDADSSMFGLQSGVEIPIQETKLTVGAGYFDYGNIKGKPVFYDPFASKGNSTLPGPDNDGDGNPDYLVYAEDFNELEIFSQFDFAAFGYPIGLFGNYTNNLAADKQDTGWLAGVTLGKCKEVNTWDCRYQYKEHDRDDVVGRFTDSDFVGGGTDSKGHEINFAYMVAKNWKVALTYFINEAEVSGDEKDYERFQFDLKFKF